jgi:hypothetical protein
MRFFWCDRKLWRQKMKNVMAKNILAAGLISMATSALAIDAADIINRMETRGYTDIETSTTLFGNTLIVGIKDGSKHEFVINKSGVVLRENIRETFKQSFWGSKIFGIFDVDGDGQLSAEERNDARNKIREKIDTDGDGQLSADERSTARSNVREKISEKMDANGDGQLSSDERNAARSNLRDKIRERLSSSSNNASNN